MWCWCWWCSRSALTLAVAALLCFSGRSLADVQLLCSSSTLSVWGEYEGPVHHFEMVLGSCTNGMNLINLNYTLITKFTLARFGYKILSYYKDQLWVEFSHPPVSCSDLKFCSIVKGETISEELSFTVRPFYANEGVYHFDVKLNIIDDLEREIHIYIRILVHVRSGDGDVMQP